jgi:hypothetical protein
MATTTTAAVSHMLLKTIPNPWDTDNGEIPGNAPAGIAPIKKP